jgi:DNA polymerase epsilon subunit 1
VQHLLVALLAVTHSLTHSLTLFVVDLHADAILQGLYRFLCGRGQTLLHDPALYRVVHLLMTKLFTKLVAELRRLGSKIIYADFYRIIIATNRHVSGLDGVCYHCNLLDD